MTSVTNNVEYVVEVPVSPLPTTYFPIFIVEEEAESSIIAIMFFTKVRGKRKKR